jgi:hypothetical protein
MLDQMHHSALLLHFKASTLLGACIKISKLSYSVQYLRQNKEGF